MNLKPGDKVTWMAHGDPQSIENVATVGRLHFTVQGSSIKYSLTTGVRAGQQDPWIFAWYEEFAEAHAAYLHRRWLLNECKASDHWSHMTTEELEAVRAVLEKAKDRMPANLKEAKEA